ncbi:MAG: hypothetical protein MJ247_04410 [Alphaproteobacteria bacterium]|nr:hypothetical protein [Alphaproteobacteria bacterium]
MKFKSSIIAGLIALGLSSPVYAQTDIDAAQKIQNVMDQVAEYKSLFNQIKSLADMDNLLENLKGTITGKLKGILSPSQKTQATILPKGADKVAEDPSKSADWVVKEMMPIDHMGPATKEDEERRDAAFQYQTIQYFMAFGRAVAYRNILNDTLKEIDKLKQDAESTSSEMDLQKKLNELTVKKLEQTDMQRALAGARASYENFDLLYIRSNE